MQTEELAGQLVDAGSLLLELSRAGSSLSMAADGISEPLISNVAQVIEPEADIGDRGFSMESAAMFGIPIYGPWPQPGAAFKSLMPPAIRAASFYFLCRFQERFPFIALFLFFSIYFFGMCHRFLLRCLP